MKKILLILSLFFISTITIFAYNQVELSIKDRITINKIINGIQKIVDEK